jgi:phosphatidylethanolamine/phosphatidyl-N-methylethanolamine N-methyltransferase
MTLLDQRSRNRDEVTGRDVATRALSGTAVEHDFVTRVYEKLASVYDLTFGPGLHPGRVCSFQKLQFAPGERLLEVGVGTGINAVMYPPVCDVTGIDISENMLEKARERIARKGVRNVKLYAMDAANLTFEDDSFDVVYAPFLISVVPDPVAVVREMRRVCRPGGRIVILNHFQSENRVLAWLERLISPLTVHIGFKSDLDLPAFLTQAGLEPVSVEKVAIPPIWSLVICVKE